MKELKNKEDTGIYLISFHLENGIWVIGAGNHKPKNGNGLGLELGFGKI